MRIDMQLASPYVHLTHTADLSVRMNSMHMITCLVMIANDYNGERMVYQRLLLYLRYAGHTILQLVYSGIRENVCANKLTAIITY